MVGFSTEDRSHIGAYTSWLPSSQVSSSYPTNAHSFGLRNIEGSGKNIALQYKPVEPSLQLFGPGKGGVPMVFEAFHTISKSDLDVFSLSPLGPDLKGNRDRVNGI